MQAGQEVTINRDAEILATEEGWKLSCSGVAVKGLEGYIQAQWLPDSEERTCVRLLPIIQSSGMGKSRLAAEYSRSHFAIPINIRDPSQRGFPPSDLDVWRYFERFRDSVDSELVALRRVCAFFVALFKRCKQVLHENNVLGDHGPDTAAWFYDKMTSGMTFEKHNEFRRGFYNSVIMLAMEIQLERTKPNDNLVEAVRFASRALCSVVGADTENASFPVLHIIFDDAPILAREGEGVEQMDLLRLRGPLIHMRRLLSMIVAEPLLVVVLSTDPKVARLANEPMRMIMPGMPPFSALGLDWLQLPFPQDGALQSVARLGYQGHLGRPLLAAWTIASEASPAATSSPTSDNVALYVASKLLNNEQPTQNALDDPSRAAKLACLSVRVPLLFYSRMDQPPTRAEELQVADHMRICIGIDPGGCMYATPSSEPLLSRAAEMVMAVPSFNIARTLLEIFSTDDVNRGKEGELLALFLVIAARDEACRRAAPALREGAQVMTVVDFVDCLLVNSQDVFGAGPSVRRRQDSEAIPFRDAFSNVLLHFNHFIQRIQDVCPSAEVLMASLMRNAGLMDATHKRGPHTVLVSLRSPTAHPEDATINRANMGYVLLCFSLDPWLDIHSCVHMFNNMDPIDYRLLEDGKDLEIPILRIVFALASKNERVEMRQPEPRAQASRFTSYDLLVSGLSSRVFAPIKEEDDTCWHSLLRFCPGYFEYDEDPLVAEAQMQARPLMDNHPARIRSMLGNTTI